MNWEIVSTTQRVKITAISSTRKPAMKLLEVARQYSFWLWDFVKGGKIRAHYKDVQFILNNWPSKEAQDKRDKYLARLLNHAASTTEFYRKYQDFKSLQDFPVVNKSIIKENLEKILSDKFDKNTLHTVTTSGSTGTPFKIFQDALKRNRHTAENIYFSEQANFFIGARLYYLRIWNVINKKGFFARWMQNIVMEEIGDLSTKGIASVIEDLRKDRSTKGILAFASTYEGVCRYLNETKVDVSDIKVSSIVAMSETLPETTKQQLQQYFSCPVVCRYSNMENGFVAQQCIADNKEYHINHASFIVELLHLERDEVVKPGERGRIVITDLFNMAMPFIRYDTGDIAIMQTTSNCSLKTDVFTHIEGRKVDFLYSTNGGLLSPHVVTNTMWKYPDVIQFQFIQMGAKEYTMKMNMGEKTFMKEMNLINDLKVYFGEDAVISIEYVHEIPLLASGKRKKILNLYKKED